MTMTLPVFCALIFQVSLPKLVWLSIDKVGDCYNPARRGKGKNHNKARYVFLNPVLDKLVTKHN